MPKRVQSAPVIGLPQIRGWSQVVLNSAKNLACSFSVEGDNANNLGRDFVSKITDLNVDSASKLHQQLLDTLSSIRKSNCRLHISCCLVLEDRIVLATHNGSILLNRNGKTGAILHSADKLNIIEGKITPADTFILATAQTQPFLEEISQRLNQNLDIDTIITSIVSGLHGLENSSLSALSFIVLEEEKVEQPIYVPTIPVQPLPPIPPDPEPIIENMPIVEPIASNNPTDDSILLPNQGTRVLENRIPYQQQQQLSTEHQAEASTKTQAQPQPKIKKPNKLKIKTVATFSKISRSFKKIFSSLKKIPTGIKHALPSKDTYVGRKPNKKTIRILLGAVVAIILVAGLLFWKISSTNQVKAQTQLQLDPIIAMVDKAKTDINENPFDAREKVNQAIKELEQLYSENENNKTAQEMIGKELTSTQDFYEEVSGRDEFSDLSVFFDLRLVESDFNTDQADLNGTTAYFLDAGTNKVIDLDIEKKQSKSLSTFDENETEKKLKDIASDEDSLFLLGGGIHEIQKSNPDDMNKLKEKGESDSAGTLMDSFGPYLYVFNPEKRNIYRYLVKDNKLSSPIGWLISKQGLEFDSVRSMAIDGDVWLSTDAGEIKKFTRGSEEFFIIDGMQDPFSTPVSIFTKENLEYIYVLESEKNRIVILTKDGKFIREIKSDSLASVTNILANEEMKIILAISGSIVFEIAL